MAIDPTQEISGGIPVNENGAGSDVGSMYSIYANSTNCILTTGSSATTIAGQTATILITYEA